MCEACEKHLETIGELTVQVKQLYHALSIKKKQIRRKDQELGKLQREKAKNAKDHYKNGQKRSAYGRN